MNSEPLKGESTRFFFDLDTENKDLPNEDVWTSYRAWAFKKLDDHISITRHSEFYTVVFPSYEAGKAETGDSLTAPMPGKIIAVKAAAGDTVKAGDPLIIMEAMKMEMTLEAPRDGTIKHLAFKDGDLVADGDVLLELEDQDSSAKP